MSGGTWGYQQFRIEELAEALTEDRHILVELLKAAARSEHIVDWAESGDTIRETRDGRPGVREAALRSLARDVQPPVRRQIKGAALR